MSNVAALRAEFDRLAAEPRPDMARLDRLATRIESEAGQERRVREITSIVGPARTHALVATEQGVTRDPVRRVDHACSAIDPESDAHKTTLTFVGDSEKSEPCPHCGRSMWKERT